MMMLFLLDVEHSENRTFVSRICEEQASLKHKLIKIALLVDDFLQWVVSPSSEQLHLCSQDVYASCHSDGQM